MTRRFSPRSSVSRNWFIARPGTRCLKGHGIFGGGNALYVRRGREPGYVLCQQCASDEGYDPPSIPPAEPDAHDVKGRSAGE